MRGKCERKVDDNEKKVNENSLRGDSLCDVNLIDAGGVNYLYILGMLRVSLKILIFKFLLILMIFYNIKKIKLKLFSSLLKILKNGFKN